ncbi:hypothetical protein [Streptomyces sp. NPDC046759]|uniref:hypothetical protein n=1 Tax=Streptomyces sp. NPDC046759 TaxID=3155019 RepID=UPI0034044EC1
MSWPPLAYAVHDKSGQVVLQWRLPTGLLQALAGDGQSAFQGEPFTDGLAVKVWSSDGKTLIAGASVTFTVTQGDAVFSGGSQSASVTTDPPAWPPPRS